MKILIATGSFKDVFSPSEAVDMLEGVFSKYGHEIIKCPFCDGGEYTFEVLKRIIKDFKEILVNEVINAYGEKVQSHYLVDENDVAHIVSSEILRLYPEEDKFKNPLLLTDYGFGQLILNAINNGFHKINLYLGGTSTVGCGMGMLQALGGKVYNSSGIPMNTPVTPAELIELSRISCNKLRFKDIKVTVIADGDAKANEMAGITGLKVGKIYKDQKTDIVDKTQMAIEKVVKISNFGYNRPFSGAAGGLLFGIDSAFDAKYILGGEYFIDLLNLKEKIKTCDYVVTGEGRYDNTACGKAPASIAGIALLLGKPVVLICGQIDKNGLPDYGKGIIRNSTEAKKLGINIILTCQKFYDEHPASGSYKEQIEYFRKMTPKLLDDLVKEMRL